MKILITGGSGFIGRHLALTLGTDGHDIHCPSEPVMGLRDRASVDSYVAELKPEVVIHLAAKTEVAYSFDDYEDFNRVNYLGTVLLAEANRRLNPNLKQFVFASTMETYGEHVVRMPFDEDTLQFPMCPYAVAKVACEKYLKYLQTAYYLPVTVLRQTNAYGRTHADFFVMERIITQMLAGGTVNLGAKSPRRNFLFIDDLIELYRTVIEKPRAIGQTFVTGPNNALRIDELADLCAEVLNWHGEIKWNTIPARPGEVYYLNSTPVKAERLLGWRPRTHLRDGIRMTADRIRAAQIKAAA